MECVAVVALLACAGCFPCIQPPVLGRAPVDLCDAQTGEAISEALLVPVYKSTSGLGAGDTQVMAWTHLYLAEPYVHHSGRPFQSTQPTAVALVGYVWIDMAPRSLALGTVWLEGVLAIAPGHKPHCSDWVDLFPLIGDKRVVPDRFSIRLARSEQPTGDLSRIRDLLMRKEIPQRPGDAWASDRLKDSGLPGDLAYYPLEVRFTRRERTLVEAFFQNALALDRAPATQPGSHPSHSASTH